ncbi:hypothetical protein L195_g053423 [Trifolium pratense]|uniref:Uncharacterized protein n=1 Tax=Trifolium pratense TaxID=57577 RepID=A0A2K3KAG0_TRIPR|nr:hypothetical protein L195_g053423 [Trifolium pratense]
MRKKKILSSPSSLPSVTFRLLLFLSVTKVPAILLLSLPLSSSSWQHHHNCILRLLFVDFDGAIEMDMEVCSDGEATDKEDVCGTEGFTKAEERNRLNGRREAAAAAAMSRR